MEFTAFAKCNSSFSTGSTTETAGKFEPGERDNSIPDVAITPTRYRPSTLYP